MVPRRPFGIEVVIRSIILSVGPVIVHVDAHDEDAFPGDRRELFDEDSTIHDGLNEALRTDESVAVGSPDAPSVPETRDVSGDFEPITTAVGGAREIPKGIPAVGHRHP